MKTVKTGKEKQLAYTSEYRQFNKAIRNGFYLEAVAIGYAIIEDRLTAFLHHAGCISRGLEELKINRAVYPYLRRLLKRDDKYSIKIKNISVKIEVITAVLNMSESNARAIDNDIDSFIQSKKRKQSIAKPGFMADLYKQAQALDRARIMEIFERIDPWRTDRNQLIHALLNKTVDTAFEAKKQCAEESYSITRDLDNYLVKPFKENNRIRKKYNIQ